MAWLEGYVISERYRTSGKNKHPRDYILYFPAVDGLRKASRLVGREVEYREGKLKVRGRIVDTHGVRGEVRARFRKGLPGRMGDGRVYIRLDSELAEALKPMPSSRTA